MPRRATDGPELTIPLAQEADLCAQVAAAPDATLAEHAACWNAAHGTTLSSSTIERAIRRLGITRKKRR